MISVEEGEPFIVEKRWVTTEAEWRTYEPPPHPVPPTFGEDEEVWLAGSHIVEGVECFRLLWYWECKHWELEEEETPAE